MEMDVGPGCVQPDVALLAEFRGWLDRERGLSAVSVRCYCKQAKAFLQINNHVRETLLGWFFFGVGACFA